MIKENNNILLLGHTRDDLLENFFIRIMRGSGLEGFVSFNKLYLKNDRRGHKHFKTFINYDKKTTNFRDKKCI